MASPLDNELVDGTWLRGHTFAAPAITAEILNTASIQVYMRLNNRDWLLPYRHRAAGTETHVDFYARPGELRIYRMTDGCTMESCLLGFSPALRFRYVITPGGTPLATPAGQAAIGMQDSQHIDTEGSIAD